MSAESAWRRRSGGDGGRGVRWSARGREGGWVGEAHGSYRADPELGYMAGVHVQVYVFCSRGVRSNENGARGVFAEAGETSTRWASLACSIQRTRRRRMYECDMNAMSMQYRCNNHNAVLRQHVSPRRKSRAMPRYTQRETCMQSCALHRRRRMSRRC